MNNVRAPLSRLPVRLVLMALGLALVTGIGLDTPLRQSGSTAVALTTTPAPSRVPSPTPSPAPSPTPSIGQVIIDTVEMIPGRSPGPDLAAMEAAHAAALADVPQPTPIAVAVTPAPTPKPTPKPTSAPKATSSSASTYTKDVYFKAGYERQIDNRTCTAASTAMMENFIARRDLNLDQMTILRYEQPRDALNDAVQHGSDPLGWSLAATHFSSAAGHPTTYAWKAYTSKTAALKAAAIAIARYGKPVGIVAMAGRHAIVMTGFTSVGNPLKGSFTLSYIWTSNPLPGAGGDGGAHTRWTPGGFPFYRYAETDATPTYDKLWIGKYIVVIPTN